MGNDIELGAILTEEVGAAKADGAKASWKGMIETASKVVTVVTVTLYVLGFLISWLHFARYGILAINFASPQYVLVGGFFAFFFGIFLFIDFVARLGSRQADEVKWLHLRSEHSATRAMQGVARFGFRVFLYFVGILGGFLIALWLTTFILPALGIADDLSNPANRASILIFYVLALLAGLCSLLARGAFETRHNIRRYFDATQLVMLVILVVGAFLSFLCLYTTFVYPLISNSLGGGRPRHLIVQIADQKEYGPLKKCLYPETAGAEWSDTLELVYDNSEMYFVLRGATQRWLVMVPKKAVEVAILDIEENKLVRERKEAPANGSAVSATSSRPANSQSVAP